MINFRRVQRSLILLVKALLSCCVPLIELKELEFGMMTLKLSIRKDTMQ